LRAGRLRWAIVPCIEGFRIHDLRHTCAAWLVSAGVPLPEVRDLLGHSAVAMTERYAHLAPERVRAAVAVLDGTVPEHNGDIAALVDLANGLIDGEINEITSRSGHAKSRVRGVIQR
jgi:hypothetical protein